MEREIELAALDLRYESYRMRNPAAEARLLAAIAFSETALKLIPGGSMRPFCDPAMVTSTSHSS